MTGTASRSPGSDTWTLTNDEEHPQANGATPHPPDSRDDWQQQREKVDHREAETRMQLEVLGSGEEPQPGEEDLHQNRGQEEVGKPEISEASDPDHADASVTSVAPTPG